MSQRLHRIGAGLCALVWLVVSGCQAPSNRLSFPDAPVAASAQERHYDIDGNGHIDFVLRAHEQRFDILEYDDDEDGHADRIYHLADQRASPHLPHLIILIDSIPFEIARQRYRDSDWTWFDEPVKVIPPFPTMSGLIFSRILGAPPAPGAINLYYDRSAGRRVNRIWERLQGAENPWEQRLHYRLGYFGNGQAFMRPRSWYQAELALALRAFNRSPDRTTIVYIASAAAMLSQFGHAGAEECLDGLERLCLQVLWERRGAVHISILSDHGHNLRTGDRIDVPAMLRAAGFAVGDHLRGRVDAVVEQDGLVNYVGIHCRDADAVAAALARRPEIELAMWLEGSRVMVRSDQGRAAIEHRAGRYRYTPLDADVLQYAAVVDALAPMADAEGFIAPEDWFRITIDHHWPDAPRRLWEAFHGLVVNTPDVMATTAPGFYVGKPSFDWFIDMASTHGGLDQQDSAAVLLTTTGRAAGPLPSDAVLPTIAPTWNSDRLRHP